MSFQIFSGIYSSFAETDAVSKTVFSSDEWLERAATNVKQAYLSGAVAEEYSLAIMAANSQRNGRVRVLDFGGGLGAVFPGVAASLAADIQLEYHVVDSAAACRVGLNCHGDDKRIHFHDSLPDDLPTLDIIHLGSVLQYIDDWQGLLHRLAEYQAPRILFSDTMTGNIPTFVSLEEYYGKRIPFRFINIDELVGYIEGDLGYRLLYKSRFIQTIQGKKGFYNMDNLPPEYRLNTSHNLLFALS